MKKKVKAPNMTTLTFHGVGGSAEIVVDQAVAIRIIGGALFAGGPVMAIHTNGAWHVGDQRLERISIKGPVRVEFQGRARSRAFGPFAEFSLVGDAAMAAGGVFARYQATEEAWDFSGDDSAGEMRVIQTDAVCSDR